MEQEKNQLIQRFAEVQNISYEAANELIGGDSKEEVLSNITNFTKQKMYSNLNRAQRRALQKQEKNKNIHIYYRCTRKFNHCHTV